MSHPLSGLCLLAALAAAGAASASALPVQAAPPSPMILVGDDGTAGVTVPEAWARASPGATTTAAAYITLKGGTQADRLVAASTPIAATAEVHVTTSDNGIMKMRPVPVVPVPPGQTVTFTPGSMHIMLMGLKKPLTAGQTFPLTLTFAQTPPVTVDVKVRGLGTGTPATTNDHSHDSMPMH